MLIILGFHDIYGTIKVAVMQKIYVRLKIYFCLTMTKNEEAFHFSQRDTNRIKGYKKPMI